MNNLLAQGKTGIPIINFGPISGFGPLGENQGANSINTFTTFVSSAIGLMTIIAIVWFVFSFILGAIGIISAGGDKQALESNRKKITSSIIGLAVVICAVFIINFIGYLLGFSSVGGILNISGMFNLIQLQ